MEIERLTKTELAFIKNRFHNLGIYINQASHTVVNGQYPTYMRDSIKFKINLIYGYLEEQIKDKTYIQEERETLL